jgi:hypothetical protein
MIFVDSVEASLSSGVLIYNGDLTGQDFHPHTAIIDKINTFREITIQGNLDNAFNNIILKVPRFCVSGVISNSFNQSQLTCEDLAIQSDNLVGSINNTSIQSNKMEIVIHVSDNIESLSNSALYALDTIELKINGGENSQFCNVSLIQSENLNMSIENGNSTVLNIKCNNSDINTNNVVWSGLKLEGSFVTLTGSGSISNTSIKVNDLNINGNFDNLLSNSQIKSKDIHIVNAGLTTLADSQVESCKLFVESTRSGSLCTGAQINVENAQIQSCKDTDLVLYNATVIAHDLLLILTGGNIKPSTIKVGDCRVQYLSSDKPSYLFTGSTITANKINIIACSNVTVLDSTNIEVGDLLVKGDVKWGSDMVLYAIKVERDGDDLDGSLKNSNIKTSMFEYSKTCRAHNTLINARHFKVKGYLPTGSVVVADVEYLDLCFPVVEIEPVYNIRLTNLYYLLLSLVSGRPRYVKTDHTSAKVWKWFCANSDQTKFRYILLRSFPTDPINSNGTFFPAVLKAARGNKKLTFNNPVGTSDFFENYPIIQRAINDLTDLTLTNKTSYFGILCPININRLTFNGPSNNVMYLSSIRSTEIKATNDFDSHLSFLKSDRTVITSTKNMIISHANIRSDEYSTQTSFLSTQNCIWTVSKIAHDSDFVNGVSDNIYRSDQIVFNAQEVKNFLNNSIIECRKSNIEVITGYTIQKSIWFSKYLRIQSQMAIQGSLIRTDKLILTSSYDSCVGSAIYGNDLILNVGDTSLVSSTVNGTTLKIVADPINIGSGILSYFTTGSGSVFLKSPTFLQFSMWSGPVNIRGNMNSSYSMYDGCELKLTTDNTTFNRVIFMVENILKIGLVFITNSLLRSIQMCGTNTTLLQCNMTTNYLLERILTENINTCTVNKFNPLIYSTTGGSYWKILQLYLTQSKPNDYLILANEIHNSPLIVAFTEENRDVLSSLDLSKSKLIPI